ncbi:MAG: hypothetical protein NTV49_01560 [Kiritimatiellaeota bacterium]|nr:hypothetical protein [Kiritimatiellota bacterium]
MIDDIVKKLKRRQQAIKEQLKILQAEAEKLEKALRALETLADVATEEAPQLTKTKKRNTSAAGRKAIAAAVRAQWAKVRIQSEAEAKVHLLPDHDRRQSNFRAEKAAQDEKVSLTMSQRVPCTCGGINSNCMYCGGTGMRDPT